MKRYGNQSAQSGVTHYDDRLDDSIVVRFASGDHYLYTVVSVGRSHLEELRKLAAAGRGLSTYISRHVHDRFAAKW